MHIKYTNIMCLPFLRYKVLWDSDLNFIELLSRKYCYATKNLAENQPKAIYTLYVNLVGNLFLLRTHFLHSANFSKIYFGLKHKTWSVVSQQY